jgi:hypothetical protein
MSLSDGGVPPGAVTAPVPIDREALRQIHFLEGEHVLRVWRTVRGFLVMTNLRCIEVARKPQLFATSDWEAGPSLFFYNLAAPRVELHRFLRLSEEREERALVLRFYLHDPYEVAQEIQAARHAGQNEWLRRRALSEAALRQSRQRWEAAHPFRLGEGVKHAIKVRCGYCGNLIDVIATRCPFCGAPQK